MTETATIPLWEPDHPYRAEEGNYRCPRNRRDEVHQEHDSWAEFAYTSTDWMDPKGTYFDSDPDYNLLYRWDWHIPDPADYEPGEEIPGQTLRLYFILQRKADCRSVFVHNVTAEDEPAVRAWLTERAKTIRAIWAPIIGEDGADAS